MTPTYFNRVHPPERRSGPDLERNPIPGTAIAIPRAMKNNKKPV